MSSILIFCRDCGKQVPSSETRDQLCLDCRVRRSVADLRDEHARLWRKAVATISPAEEVTAAVARIDDYECVIDASLNQAFRRNQLARVAPVQNQN